MAKRLRLAHSFGPGQYLRNQAMRAAGRLGWPHMARGLIVEPLTDCNLRCPLCPAPAWRTQRHKHSMTLAQFRRLVDQSRRHVPRYAFNFACEPLLHPDIAAMTAYVHQARRLSFISTNCVHLTPELGRELIRAHLDFIYLSIDGLDASTHTFYRRGSDFEQILANIMAFVEDKRRLGARHPYVVIYTLRHARNDHLEAEYRRFWAKHLGRGVDEFMFYPLHLHQNIHTTAKDRAKALKYLPRDLANSRYRLDDDGQVRPRLTDQARYNRCFEADEPAVTSQGDLVVCCKDVFARHVLGNVFEQDFGEIWQSERALALRRKARSMEFGMCAQCSVRGM